MRSCCAAQAGAKVPRMLYQHWEVDNGGLILVLEDLSCQHNAATSSAAVTRLTQQALALDSAQVRTGQCQDSTCVLVQKPTQIMGFPYCLQAVVEKHQD